MATLMPPKVMRQPAMIGEAMRHVKSILRMPAWGVAAGCFVSYRPTASLPRLALAHARQANLLIMQATVQCLMLAQCM